MGRVRSPRILMFLMISILFVKRNSKYLLATLNPIVEYCSPAMCDSIPEPFSFSSAFSAHAVLLKPHSYRCRNSHIRFLSQRVRFLPNSQGCGIKKLPFAALQTLSAALFTSPPTPGERKVHGRAGEQQHLCLKGRGTTFW